MTPLVSCSCLFVIPSAFSFVFSKLNICSIRSVDVFDSNFFFFYPQTAGCLSVHCKHLTESERSVFPLTLHNSFNDFCVLSHLCLISKNKWSTGTESNACSCHHTVSTVFDRCCMLHIIWSPSKSSSHVLLKRWLVCKELSLFPLVKSLVDWW